MKPKPAKLSPKAKPARAVKDKPKGLDLSPECLEAFKLYKARDRQEENLCLMRAVGAAAPGSNSRSPKPKSSLSAATHPLKVLAVTLDPCWSAITVLMGSGSPEESGPAFQRKLWRIFTGRSRN
jgi:hypothetical protein